MKKIKDLRNMLQICEKLGIMAENILTFLQLLRDSTNDMTGVSLKCNS